MNYIKLIAILLLLSGCGIDGIKAQNGLRHEVIVETSIYTVSYNEILQQPNWLKYTSLPNGFPPPFGNAIILTPFFVT